MQIVLNPKVKKVLIAILILVLVAIVFLVLRPALLAEPAVSANQQTPDALAAVDAVTAFYTLDSAESSELWAARVCAYASEQGCAIVRTYFAPTIQILLQENSIQTGCTVLPVRMAAEDGDKRIWQLSVTLDHPWENLDTQTQTVFVEMAQGSGQWLMNRILFEQEAERFLTATP
jgi:hypothetical protein